MESKKQPPATQQPIQQQHHPHHVHPAPSIHTSHHHALLNNRLSPPQPYQMQPNGIVHQLLMQSPNSYQSNLPTSPANPDHRSPLLENQQELYGTRQTADYARHYGANENYQHPQRVETQQNHNINQDIMHAIPKGYNAEVYQDYLKRNPPKETNQIYQNHQSAYQPNVSQYTNKPYLPYTSRIQPPTESNTELLRRQYNEIQQMKLRQQMKFQNEAQMQQQQTFAERQLLLQQMHGVQPPPNLQQSIYSDGNYKESDRYNTMSQQSEREDRFQPQSPTYQTTAQAKQVPSQSQVREPPMSPMKSSVDSSSPSVKSPLSSESRRSSGGTQALRSPIAQRPPSAPVSMAGMLYKQGSDGLKVWRKRWFVLAEYCLFYYKSQDEEKLLGSVLLPSYKVSLCTAEDKVLRKFAFKLEHANMRTYVLAAHDQESQAKWVRALTMAALMQDHTIPEQKMNQTTERNQIENEEDGDDAGPTYANAPPKPRRSNDGYGSPAPDIYDPNYDILQKPASHYSQGTSQNWYIENNQPRYSETNHNRYVDANQKRYSESNAQRYPDSNQNPYQDSTGPSASVTTDNNYDRTLHSPQYDHYGATRPYDAQNLSLPLTNTSSNRLEHQNSASAYRNDSQTLHYDSRTRSHQQQQWEQQKTNDDILSEQIYGRNQNQSLLYMKEKTKSDMPRQMCLQNRNYKPGTGTETAQILTDVKKADTKVDPNRCNRENYIDSNKPDIKIRVPSSERLPIERRTPDAYGRSAVLPNYVRCKTSDYEDVYQAYSAENEYGMSYSKPTSPPSFTEKKNIQEIQKCQGTNRENNNNNTNQNQSFSGPSILRRKKMQSSNPTSTVPRPHSADFLEYEARNEVNKTLPSRNIAEPAKQPQRPKSSLDINSYYDPSSDRYYSEESYAEKMRQSAQYLQQRGMTNRDFQVPLAKYTSGLAQKQLDSACKNGSNNNYESSFDVAKDNVSYNSKFSDIETLNSNWTLKEKSAMESQKDYRAGSALSDRSAVSGLVYEGGVHARENMPENFVRSISARLPSMAGASEGKDGERKREESMKRLLEWKQRMLQSPLTRKSTPASISLARSLNQSRQSTNRTTDLYKPKACNNNSSYNSYSSDDEASVSVSGAGLQNNITNQQTLGKKSFVGSNTSIGRSGRDNNIPVRAVSPRVRWVEDKRQLSNSQQNLSTSNLAEETWARSPSRVAQPIRAVSPRVRHTSTDDICPAPDRTLARASSVEQLLAGSLTAGELLGRSHEELVLLLIQLRRTRAHTHHLMQRCARHIDSIKDCLDSMSALEQQESLQRLEELKMQLLDLEQQYRKSKPLVQLVDNMVKLGSLYSRPSAAAASTIERLERNQRLRRKVLAEQADEQRRWADGEVGDPQAARARVEELWALERQLAAEAATLQALKADKEAIETLLTGVRSKFAPTQLPDARAPPAASEAASGAASHTLEADLARVHLMLAHNSKKLEATVADNARLERELLALRRALHSHRHAPPPHHRAAAAPPTPTTALLEDEVSRVQQLVSALQQQRQELSRAVRRLTQQSRALQTAQQPPPPTQSYPQGPMKRRPQSTWQETDLDSGECVEHGDEAECELAHSAGPTQCGMRPLYVDTRTSQPHPDAMSPISDDGAHATLGNIANTEKPEIKTVRIVKRESERRHRDRTIQPDSNWNTPNITASLDHLLEEELTPNYCARSTSLPRANQPYDYYSKSRNQPPNYLRLSNVNVPCDNMELSPKYPSSPSLNYDYSRDNSAMSNSYSRDNSAMSNSYHDNTSLSNSYNQDNSAMSTSYSRDNSLCSSYNRYDYGDRTLSLSAQFLNSPTDSNQTLTNNPLSKTSSIGSLTRNAELSPIFKSEAAKQIITEMSGDGSQKTSASVHKRQVPKEKRRHYTAPHHLSAKTLSEISSEYLNQEKLGRSLDDADLERALRAPPDVVRSAIAPQRYAESTIDQLLLAPRKILIPERYVPEQPPELSPEEQKKRLEKVESIKKMLSSTSSDPSKSPDDQEKRQRDHLLQMNQILAKQVMEMSKIVAGTNGEQAASATHN